MIKRVIVKNVINYIHVRKEEKIVDFIEKLSELSSVMLSCLSPQSDEINKRIICWICLVLPHPNSLVVGLLDWWHFENGRYSTFKYLTRTVFGRTDIRCRWVFASFTFWFSVLIIYKEDKVANRYVVCVIK